MYFFPHSELAHAIMRVVVLDPCAHACLHVVVATVLRILVACLGWKNCYRIIRRENTYLHNVVPPFSTIRVVGSVLHVDIPLLQVFAGNTALNLTAAVVTNHMCESYKSQDGQEADHADEDV